MSVCFLLSPCAGILNNVSDKILPVGVDHYEYLPHPWCATTEYSNMSYSASLNFSGPNTA